MRYPILMVSSILLASSAFATDLPVDEFRYKGDGLACITRTFKPDDGYLPCLKIGPIRIGQRESEVLRLLGDPWKVIDQDKSTSIKVFPAESSEESKPYWVVTFKNKTTESVQFTGKNPKVAVSFSSIKLGDRSARVLEILGKPSATSPVESIDGTLWSYDPFPISLEIVNDQVYSIRLSRADR